MKAVDASARGARDEVTGLEPLLVHAWVTTPTSNFGVALLGTSVNTNVATRENASTVTRPVLTVVYVP